jgi:hypothetical protein
MNMKKEANSIVKLIFYGICILFFIYQAGYALGKFVGNETLYNIKIYKEKPDGTQLD